MKQFYESLAMKCWHCYWTVFLTCCLGRDVWHTFLAPVMKSQTIHVVKKNTKAISMFGQNLINRFLTIKTKWLQMKYHMDMVKVMHSATNSCSRLYIRTIESETWSWLLVQVQCWWCTLYTCTSHVYLCKTLNKFYISFKEQCTCTHNELVALSF